MPALAVLAASVAPPGADGHGGGLTAYGRLVHDPRYRSALLDSLGIAGSVGCASAAIAFVAGFTRWSPTWRKSARFSDPRFGPVSPRHSRVGDTRCQKVCGMERGSLWIAGLSQMAWCLPFCSALILTANGSIPSQMLDAAVELGSPSRSIAREIILPQTWPAVLSATLLGALFSLNDYIRASYLAGSAESLSQYVYGKVKSGSDASTFAVGGVNVLLGVFCLATILVSLLCVHRVMAKRMTF